MTTKQDSAPDAERIGAYRVVRRLATGGTSDVLLAKAEGPHGFERTVVLKVLLSTFGKDEEIARMFAREASAYARLSHPAIVRLFDFFAVPKERGGQLVMVLEYVDGPPLARLKSMVKAVGKELDDKAAIYVATCIFDALAAAHSAVDDTSVPAPVIHRDVNPSNVLIPWDGYPKLADFGVAKVTGLSHQSVAGMIKGTYGYMAPEQVTGGEAVTPRSDVYAAAIILWELLTRRRAFQRGALPEMEALRAMAEPRLPALESIRSDVDRTVRDGLRRALEPRAERRKITAEEMVSILSAVVPLEQGRERLTSVLGLVRNDSRAANAQPSIAPPAMHVPTSAGLAPTEIVIPGAPKVADFGALKLETTPSRLLNKLGSPPRPSSARMAGGAANPNDTAKVAPAKIPGLDGKDNDPPTPRVSSDKMPAAAPAGGAGVPLARISSQKMAVAASTSESTVRELLSLPTRPVMPAATGPGPLVGPPPQPNRPASRPNLPAVSVPMPLPRPSEPPRQPSASERLAGAVPDEMKGALDSITPSRPLSILDSLTDSMVPPELGRMSAPPDSPRTSKPLKDLTGGLGLRDAIDEIMKASSRAMPAAPVTTPPGEGPPAPAPPTAPPVMRETTRVPADVAEALIGQIPPAPPPMKALELPSADAEAALPPPPNPRSSKDDFPYAADDPEGDVTDTVVAPEPIPKPTPRMNRIATPKPMAQTLAMVDRPTMPSDTPGSPSGAPGTNAATTTGPMPKYQLPPPGFHAVPNASTSAPPVAARPLDARPSSQPPPPKTGISVGTVAVVLVVLIGLGIAGTVGFARYQAHKQPSATVPSPRPTQTQTNTAASTPVSAPVPVPSATPSASVEEPATSASAAPPASVSAAPSASAPAEPVADAMDGMGLIKTPNAAPGRRIFVDEKAVAQTPDSVSVKCGARVVKLGSSGKTQNIDVPCGGEIVVGDVK